jgi:S-DNA-T family DNA segregation ATPase FtsK/SpoIIIE
MSLFTTAGCPLWWAVLFPAISIPIIASLTLGISYGPRTGLVASIHGQRAVVDDEPPSWH